MKITVFWLKCHSLKFVAKSLIDNVNIGHNGLVQSIWQAITWTNIDPDLCCHMVSQGHSELNTIGLQTALMWKCFCWEINVYYVLDE